MLSLKNFFSLELTFYLCSVKESCDLSQTVKTKNKTIIK